MSIGKKKDAQTVRFHCQVAFKRNEIDIINNEMCGEVQDKVDSLKRLNGDSVAIDQEFS